MIKIKVNDAQEIEINLSKNEIIMDGKLVQADSIKIDNDKYHLIFNDASYTIELLDKSENGKELIVSVNGKKQLVTITDEFDELLHKLGMDKLSTNKINEVKAPMPGLVLKIVAKEGDVVKKGDALLVLEAMKMENIIKATGEGVVKKIIAQSKQAVEKNQVLIIME